MRFSNRSFSIRKLSIVAYLYHSEKWEDFFGHFKGFQMKWNLTATPDAKLSQSNCSRKPLSWVVLLVTVSKAAMPRSTWSEHLQSLILEVLINLIRRERVVFFFPVFFFFLYNCPSQCFSCSRQTVNMLNKRTIENVGNRFISSPITACPALSQPGSVAVAPWFCFVLGKMWPWLYWRHRLIPFWSVNVPKKGLLGLQLRDFSHWTLEWCEGTKSGASWGLPTRLPGEQHKGGCAQAPEVQPWTVAGV